MEIDMGEADSNQAAVVSGNYLKTLVVYEVDLGLNHVYRKFAEPLPKTAHALIPVPGSSGINENDVEGPGGVIVACENFIIYKK
jgi:splicing factor 3B subunit 3